MTLDRFLSLSNTLPSQFAARIGVSASTITRIVRGERRPNLETLQKIVRATEGAVTADDFMLPGRETERAA